jgi:hypothetical protein
MHGTFSALSSRSSASTRVIAEGLSTTSWQRSQNASRRAPMVSPNSALHSRASGVLVTHSSIRNFGPAFFAITHSEFPG